MKLACLFSGGKDSNYALYEASKEHEVVCLISMKSKNKNSYMFQEVGNELVVLQSKALEIPLIHFETKGEKELELEDLKEAIRQAKEEFKIEGVVTGAIKSVYQSSRIQKVCDELDLWCFNPLWQIDEEKFIEKLIEDKFEIIIVGIFSYPLDESYLGKIIDENFLKEFRELNKKYKTSIAGEGGEYESLILNGPLYKKKLVFKKTKKVMDAENSGMLEITEVELE